MYLVGSKRKNGLEHLQGLLVTGPFISNVGRKSLDRLNVVGYDRWLGRNHRLDTRFKALEIWNEYLHMHIQVSCSERLG